MREQDDTCEYCTNGAVTCWECDGEGRVQKWNLDTGCRMCEGLGWWICEDCDEDASADDWYDWYDQDELKTHNNRSLLEP